MEAKRYGAVALVLCVAFVGGCFAFIVANKTDQPRPELTARSEQAGNPTDLQPQSEVALSQQVEELPVETVQAPTKNSSTTVHQQSIIAPVFEQVYIDSGTRLMYMTDCERPPGLLRVARAVAVKQGYTLAPACGSQGRKNY